VLTAAEYLAYEQWEYPKPNRAAVDSAKAHIIQVLEALQTVGFDCSGILADFSRPSTPTDR
jgi:hypothetical protein